MNDLFKALADPTRRSILDLLKRGDKSAGEIASSFNITGASISHHMTVLYQAGLVQKERKGQQIIYSLNTTVFQEIIEWIYKLKGDEDEIQ
ncbi:autorepressor SdpR family transcription factor [Spirochaeta cellobiosiphila]|uniref:autorepressor SdpR family transcription factor n=1 Tax=Spirochaeta cellobiosiphila TaxID=504483 RepID=UPI0003FCA6F5|nr:autorepressor SdpR family transcription factor [Spirochaeta cellobiosiphila]